MNMTKIWAIVRKEWAEVFKNRLVIASTLLMPLMMTAMPLIMLYAMKDSPGAMSDSLPPEYTAQLCGGELNEIECGQFVIITQYLMLFMMIPIFLPIMFAAYSIVGEKSTRTLEPLLATPISTVELLAGKALAAVIPAVLATWLGYLIFVIGTLLITGGSQVAGKFFEPLWLLAIFAIGPLLSVAAVSLAVMISSRVNDPRVAEQVSGLFVLPLVGLFIAQMSGQILINEQVILWIVLVLLAVDAGLLAFATQLFRRETILTRWK